MRPIGIGLSGAAMVILGAASLVRAFQHRSTGLAWSDLVIGLVSVGTVLLFWVGFPSERRVRTAADTYAERLLDAAFII